MKNFYNIQFLLLAYSISLYAAPTIELNYTAANAQDAFEILFVPFNPTLAVGSQQAVLSTYQIVRSFDKHTGIADGVINIDSDSWIGNPDNNNDLWLMFNPFMKRWIFSCEDINVTFLQLYVSSDDPITFKTTWQRIIIPPDQINPLGGGANGFIDYQQPGFDQNAWYNGVATFDADGNFIGSSLTVIPSSSIVNESPNITVFPGLFPEPLFIVQEGFACPATNFDANPTYGYFLWVIYDTPAAPNSTVGNTVQLYRILDAGSNTPTLGPLVTVALPESFAYNTLSAAHKDNLFGDGGAMQTNFGRISAYPHVRNHQLYMCQDIQMNAAGEADPDGDRVGIRYYQFDLTGGTGIENPDTVPTLVQSGTLYDSTPTDPKFYYLSAIMTNKNGDMVISFNISGVNDYIDAVFVYRYASDAPGTLSEPVYLTHSEYPCNFSANVSLTPGPNVQRWGDQSIVVTDPDDDIAFWISQNWAGLQNAYAFQVAKVRL